MSVASQQLTRAYERADEAGAPAARAPALDALFLLNCLSIGGSERKIVRLVNCLRRRGRAVAIAYLNGPDTLAPLLDPQVPCWHLQRRGKFSLAALRQLSSVLDRARPRVVFAVNLYPTWYVLGAVAALRGRAPATVSLVNTTDFGSGQAWRKALYKRVLKRFDSVVYGCEAQRDVWLDRRDPSRSRSSVIYNGVDLGEFDGPGVADELRRLRARWQYDQRSFVIGSVGRMIAAKNHAALIDATAALRAAGLDARLLLVGDGPLREGLERRAAAHGIKAATAFAGNVSDVRPALAAMDVFVLPSLYVETFSNAALEAMAMGKPVLLSHVGGAAEMVRDGVDGWVIPKEALTARLSQQLQQLACDGALRARMGRAARQRVEALFSFDTMADQYEGIIERASDGHHR